MALSIAIALITKNDKVFIARRPDTVDQGGKWEFPGGKIEPGENGLQAAIRECDEEIGIQVKAGARVLAFDYEYPKQRIHFEVFHFDDFTGLPYGAEGQVAEWVKISDLRNYQFPDANIVMIEALETLMQSKEVG